MKLNNINPHIRFAKNIKNALRPEYLRAVDYHFYYMLSKDCILNINDTSYTLAPGTIVIIPPGIKYFFEINSIVEVISINFDYTQNHSHIANEIEPVEEKRFDFSKIIEKCTFETHPFLNEPIVVNNMSYLHDDVNKILDEFSYKKQLYKEVSSAVLKNIIYEIVRHITFDSNSSESINLILDYIHNHYSEEIDNNLLSAIVGYHPYHLNRLMKTYTGTTIRQYIINYRIEFAKRYLRETNIQISKISEICGYLNFSNFSTEFKRKVGLTPSVYRKETRHLL